MRISLYRFNGKSNVANKVDNLQALYSADITPYGAFDSTNVVFKLDRMLDANICKYEFNNHAYYGTCEVNVDTDGAYVYNVKSDSLTTAWYNDCMNVNSVCKFSHYGDKKLLDNRINYKNYIVRQNIIKLIDPVPAAEITYRDYMVIIAVKRQKIREESALTNPNFDIWAFTPEAFNALIDSINEKADTWQIKYVPSIYAIFLVPGNELPSNIWYSTIFNRIYLYAMLGDSDSQTESAPVGFDGHLAFLIKSGSVNVGSGDFGKSISKSINYALTSYRQNSIFTLHVRDGGDFNFRYSEVSKNNNITKIGYHIYYDFLMGQKLIYLMINDEILPDYCIRTMIPYSFAISYDSSIERWDRVAASVAGNCMTIAQTAINPNGASGIFNVGQTILNTMTTINDAIYNKELGARNTVGNIGASAETMSDLGSYVIIKENQPIALSAFQALFGYPDGEIRNMKSLKGYVETEKCKLTENGLPRRIIDEAESACDAGFYII